MEAARDANLTSSDDEDGNPFGDEETPGGTDQSLAGDFSVTTTTATATRISASSRSMTVNAEITPNEVLATPASFVFSASQVPATPNRSMRVPEDSFFRNQTAAGNETFPGTTLASFSEEAGALTMPTDDRLEEQMEIDRQRLEEPEEQRRLLVQHSDSEESDTEDEENQQPPLTFSGTKTSIQGDVPVLPTHPGRAVVIPPLPIGGGSSRGRGTLPHRRVLSPVTLKVMRHSKHRLRG